MDTECPPWREPPIFSLPGISSPEISTIPETYAVLVSGINGTNHPQLLDSFDTRPEFINEERVLKFSYDPMRVVGESASEETLCGVAADFLDFLITRVDTKKGAAGSSSIMYYAYDFGGTVVKQALVMASLNEKYRMILDQTSVVVFYGTPHQSSYCQTWASNAHRILHSCFRGLLEPWVSVFIEKMSTYQQHLNVQFRELGSGFRVMNICQKSGSPNYDLITDAACATVGLDTEVMVLLERSHYQLGILMGYQQQEYMKETLLNEVTRHWKVYRKFVATLRIGQQKPPGLLNLGKQYQGESLRLFLADNSARMWQEASSNIIIRLILADHMDFEGFCQSFSSHVMTANEGKVNIVLQLGRDHPSTVQELYASLCLQFLEQQPSLIQWIRHLYPNLRDAILGVDRRWKSRALARCLRTLLLVPKGGVTYCLIHYASDGPRKDVVAQVLALTQNSEIPLRLLVSTPPNTKTGLDDLDNSPSVDLSSSDGTAQMTEKGERPLQGTIKDRSTELWATMVIPHGEVLYRYEESAAPKTGLKLLSDSGLILRSLEQRLSTCIDNGMTWALRAMAWVSFAIRPLSRDELEQALEVVCAEERSIPIEMQHGRILLHALERALPDFLHITDDAVFALPQLRENLSGIWTKHLGYSVKPELYLARTCFALTAGVFPKRLPTASTYLVSKAKSTADHEVTEFLNSKLSNAHQAIMEYATRYWIEHHFRGTRDAGNAEDDFRETLGASPLFDQRSWIQLLASEYWSPDIGEEIRDKIHPDIIQNTFELCSFDACYLSFRMATLPLTAEDNFDWLLFGEASEHLLEDVYFNMILRVRGKLSNTCWQSGTLERVIAAASDNLRTSILTKFDSDNFLHKSFIKILLTTIAIGNTSATTELLAMVPTYPLGHKKDDAGTSGLGTALQVACEYGDRDVVKRILNLIGDLHLPSLEESYPWNALHVACHQGQASLVAELMESDDFKHMNQIVDTVSPSQFNPLLITSARGLFTLSDALKPLQLKIPMDEDGSMSALQLACKYGFLKTVESLFITHGCRLSLKNHDNHALFLALRCGNDILGKRVYEKYFEVVVEAMRATEHRRSHNSDNNDSPSSTDDEVGRDVLIAGEMLSKALFTAVECEGMSSILQSIMNGLKKPLKSRDSKGRTPLMVSAMFRPVELAELLYVKGDNSRDNEKRTAMHYACAYGNLAVVEFLLTEGDSPSVTAQDVKLATPVTVAAVGGYPKIVELLVPRLSSEDLKAEFTLAAKHGLERTLDLILKAATSIDLAVRKECVNAKDKSAKTPLYYAAEFNHPRIVQLLLLRGGNLEAADKLGLTPLAIASLSSSLESMRVLLDAGASTEAPLQDNRRMLTETMFYKKEQAVRLLLESGAVTRLSGFWDMHSSLLEFALKWSSTSVLKVLLEHFDKMRNLAAGDSPPDEIPTPTEALRLVIKGAGPSSFDVLVQVWNEFDPVIREDDYEIGPILTYAAAYGSFETLCRIWERSNCLKNQINVNEAGGCHGTALQAALGSQRDSAAKVKVLIEWGARPVLQSGKGGEGPTPALWNSSGVFNTNSLQGYWGTALHAAAFSADKEIVAIILNQQSDLKNHGDMMGRLPLHLAALGDNWGSAKELTSDTSTIASKDRQCRNALHMACGVGNISFVQEVLQDKRLTSSLINKADIDGWTPLHWACRSKRGELVEILMDKGARITERAMRPAGWLPYHVAIHDRWKSPALLSRLRVDNGRPSDTDRAKPAKAGWGMLGKCTSCNCSIFGDRYVCTGGHATCVMWQLCFKCFEHRAYIHFPHHKFETRDPLET